MHQFRKAVFLSFGKGTQGAGFHIAFSRVEVSLQLNGVFNCDGVHEKPELEV